MTSPPTFFMRPPPSPRRITKSIRREMRRRSNPGSPLPTGPRDSHSPPLRRMCPSWRPGWSLSLLTAASRPCQPLWPPWWVPHEDPYHYQSWPHRHSQTHSHPPQLAGRSQGPTRQGRGARHHQEGPRGHCNLLAVQDRVSHKLFRILDTFQIWKANLQTFQFSETP